MLLVVERSYRMTLFLVAIPRFFERIMTTSGSYFVLKLGWSEGWVDDHDKIILLDGPQEFTNNDYWELSKVFNNHTQR